MNQWLEQLYNPPPDEQTEFKAYVDTIIKRRNSEGSRMKSVVNLMAERQQQNYDVVVPVTGGEGSGKSSLINMMCEEDATILDVPYSLDTNVAYLPTWQGLMNLINSLPRYSPVNVDEAIRTMYVRNWNSKKQKDMNSFFTTIRKKNMLIGLAIPSLFELDSFFKNLRAIMWIHIFGKGKAGVFVKDPNPLNSDPFNTKLAKKIIDEKVGLQDRFDIDEVVRTLYENVPNFVTWFKFPAPDPIKEAHYLANVEKYNVQMPEQEAVKKNEFEDMRQLSIVTLFEASDAWTIPKLAERFKLSEYKVRQIINKARKIEEKEATLDKEPEEKGDDEDGK